MDGRDAAGPSHSAGNDAAGAGDVMALGRSRRLSSGLSGAAGPDPPGTTATVPGGHRRVETTARYAHLARDSARESAERIAVSIAADTLC